MDIPDKKQEIEFEIKKQLGLSLLAESTGSVSLGSPARDRRKDGWKKKPKNLSNNQVQVGDTYHLYFVLWVQLKL